jgi:hypothetical protein
MKLVITILQGPGRRPRVIKSEVHDLLLSDMRKIFEAEQVLNNLPGTTLRWHLNVEEELLTRS